MWKESCKRFGYRFSINDKYDTCSIQNESSNRRMETTCQQTHISQISMNMVMYNLRECNYLTSVRKASSLNIQ